MSNRGWMIAGGIGGTLLLFLALPDLLALLIVLLVLGVPVAGYFILTPQQRKRLQRLRQRRQIGR